MTPGNVLKGRMVGAALRVAQGLLMVAALTAGAGLAAIMILGPENARRFADSNGSLGSLDRTGRGGDTRMGDPGTFIGELRRGLTFYQRKQFDEALEALNKALSLNTNTMTAETLGPLAKDSSLPETHSWRLAIEAYVARADVLQKLHRYDDSLADLDQAVALNARDTQTRHKRGVTYILIGRSDDAIGDFDAILSRMNNPEALFSRGVAKYVKSDWRGATIDFEGALTLNSNSRKYAAWRDEAMARNSRSANTPYPPLAAEDILRAVYGRGFIPPYASDLGAIGRSMPINNAR